MSHLVTDRVTHRQTARIARVAIRHYKEVEKVLDSYLFCKLYEMPSLEHDISREILANNNLTTSECLGFLQHGAPVLR